VTNRALTPDGNATVTLEVARWASGAALPGTITGTLRTHARVKSRHLRLPRDVVVYVPPGYDRQPDLRYAVLYLHDGQNLFDPRGATIGIEWGVDETAERLILADRIEPIIVVGISSTEDRLAEYSMPADSGFGPGDDSDPRRPAGLGDRYARFLVEELKPFIDKKYRTRTGREHTAVGGASLGGIISLYIGSLYPDVFSGYAVVSPTLSWNDGQILRQLEKDGAWLKRMKIWLDVGTAEGRQRGDGTVRNVENARALVKIFDRWGLAPGRDYYYWEEFGARHNEAAWASRLDKILLFLFAK
jgi:predicted alpha/beta superfamily hydrolase